MVENVSTSISPICDQSDVDIINYLSLIEDNLGLEKYRLWMNSNTNGEEAFHLRPLYTSKAYSIGYIESLNQEHQFFDIHPANNISPDNSLKNTSVDIVLDYLFLPRYPRPIFEHSIILNLETTNSTQEKSEPIAYNQLIKYRSGQSAPISGIPLVQKLNICEPGFQITFRTILVENDENDVFMEALKNPLVSGGLELASVIQPALIPGVIIFKAIAQYFCQKESNKLIQEFQIGFDFTKGALGGARIKTGDYIIAQVDKDGDLDWGTWKYDIQRNIIVDNETKNLSKPKVFNFNALIIRISSSK